MCKTPNAIVMIIALCISGASVCGCTTLPSGEGWGHNATISPGWKRVRDAASEAATDPWVWVPLAGAAAFQIDHSDRRASNWARDHTPVFGSQKNAQDWSDTLRSVTVLAQLGTLTATPSGSDTTEWLFNKVKGALVEIAAIEATNVSTSQLKSTVGRERPNDVDDESFPSGHSSSAAVHSELAIINLDSIEMDPRLRTAADFGLRAVAIGTQWARIESGWHYPSDTLAGMALGNFFGSFFSHAFLNEETSQSVSLMTTDRGAFLSWEQRF